MRRRRILSPILALLIGALVAGCSAVPPATPDIPGSSPDAAATAAGETAGARTPRSPTETRPPDRGFNLIAWILSLGPGAPSGPDEVNAYVLLEEPTRRNCRSALEADLPDDATETLYRGLAAACLAAFHGRSDLWSDAEAAYAALDDPPQSCLSQVAYQQLKGAVEKHRENPTARFRPDSSTSFRPPCPTIRNVTAAHDGSTLRVRIRGRSLDQVEVVALQEHHPTAECPLEPDGYFLPEFVTEGNRLRATLEDDLSDVTSVWVGLIAEPQPWIAAHACVPVERGAPTDTTSPEDVGTPSPAP